MIPDKRTYTAEWLKRRLNALKAERGWNWAEVAARLSTSGIVVTPGSLMSKHSRSTFTAVELIAILQAMGVTDFDIPVPGVGPRSHGQRRSHS